MKKQTKAQAHAERMAKIHAAARAEVATGRCPRCGAGIHRNSSILGWWQCDRSGSGHFRIDQSGASCSWDAMTGEA